VVEVMPELDDGEPDPNFPKPTKSGKKKLKEVAPPGKKYERMVKHIKKNYPKEKEGIAYATAWKHRNKNK
jgi:hypothetical protein